MLTNTLTERSDIYNARICLSLHCLGLSKIRLDSLNDVNNGFTWMKCFAQGCAIRCLKLVLLK